MTKTNIFITLLLLLSQFIVIVILFAILIPGKVLRVRDIYSYTPNWYEKLCTIIAFEDPIKIVNKERNQEGLPIIAPGEAITINLRYNKLRDITAVYSRQVICENGMIFTIGEKGQNYQPTGYHEVPTDYNVLPESAPSGTECWLAFPTTYKINSLNEVSVTPETERFIVK